MHGYILQVIFIGRFRIQQRNTKPDTKINRQQIKAYDRIKRGEREECISNDYLMYIGVDK